MMKKTDRFSSDIHIKNRKASFEYEFLDKYEAGIVLKGAEVKSIREGKVSLQEAYCYIENHEIVIKGLRIAQYSESSFNILDPIRPRKLLLKKQEISKLKSKSDEQGLTIVPYRLYLNKRGIVKLEIMLARGKKLYDKRQTIKQKDQNKELQKLKLI